MKLSKKFTLIAGILSTVLIILIIIIHSLHISNKIALVDYVQTVLLKKSVLNTTHENVQSDKNCSVTGKIQDKPLSIFTDLYDTMRGVSETSKCQYNHPDIVHYVKFTDQEVVELTFQEFLAILSMHKFYEPSKIVIYSNAKLNGKYWNLAKDLSTKIEVRNVERFKRIGNFNAKPIYITHEVDAFKVKTMSTQGGIFADFDTIMINKTQFRAKQRRCECLIGCDDDPCTRLCAGFVSCSSNSSFARDWWKGYELDYHPSLWVYNAGILPTNLLRKCPSCYNVYVDETIGACFSNPEGWLKPNGIDWRSRSAVHYLNHCFGVESWEITPDALRTRFKNTSIGELFQHVLGEPLFTTL